MSACCTCGNGCAAGCGCRVFVLPDNPVEQWNFETIGVVGVPVLAGVSGVNVQFYTVASGSAALTVALDAGNGAVMFTLDVDEIINDLPQATTTQRGVGETATDAEAIAKASLTVFLTPSNLAALGSSTTFAGLVELATDAETQTGVSTTLAVTPAGLASVVQQLGTTTTFTDAAGRGAAFPDFEGQFGAQLDTNTAYLSDGVGAGDWLGILTLDSSANTMTANTNLTPNGFIFEVFGNGTFEIDQTTFSVANNTSNFNNGNLRFGDTGALNFDWAANVILQIAGSTIPANSVLITSGTNGDPSSALINTFLSEANTTIWGLPTGTLSRTALAAYAGQNISNPPTEAEVQALDDYVQTLSQKVCALITDLRATMKPNAT